MSKQLAENQQLQAATLTDKVQAMNAETKVQVFSAINTEVSRIMGYVVPVYTAFLVKAYELDGLEIRTATAKELHAYIDKLDKEITDKNAHIQAWHKTRMIASVEGMQRRAVQCAAFVKALPEGERNALAGVLKSNDTTLENLALMVPDKVAVNTALTEAGKLATTPVPASKIKAQRATGGATEQTDKPTDKPTDKAKTGGPFAALALQIANDGALTKSASSNAKKLLAVCVDDAAFVAALAYIFQDGALTRETVQAQRKVITK